MKKTLYELIEQLQFLEALEPEDVEHETRLRDMLEKTTLDIETKTTNIGKYVLSLRAEVAAIKQEEDRLHRRRQAIDRHLEWLKSYLFTEMRRAMIMKVKSDICTVSIQKSPPSVEVEDPYTLSEEFQRVTIEAKKKEILEYFNQTGVIPPGTNIITDKEHIVIR